MAGFANKCPKCRTAIKLKEEMDGKKARCPKCQAVFRAKSPASAKSQGKLPKAKAASQPDTEEFSFFDQITDEDRVDRGVPGDSSDELDVFGEGEDSDGGSRRRGKGADGKHKEPMNRDLLIGGIVVGAGLILLLGIVLAGIFVVPEVLSGPTRMAWMPSDTESFLEIDPEAVWESEALTKLRESKLGPLLHDNVDRLFTPLKLSDFAIIAVGYPAKESEHPEPVIVFYGSSSFNVQHLKSQATGYVETTHKDQKYFKNEADQRCAYFPQADVMVSGTEAHILSAIDNLGICAAESKFTLPFRRSIVYVSINTVGYRPLDMSSILGEPNIVPVATSAGLKGLSVMVTALNDTNVEAVLTYDTPEAAEKVAEAANSQIPERIEKLTFDREERNKTDPTFKLNTMGDKGLMTAHIELLESMSVMPSGSNVEVEFRYPTPLVDHALNFLSLVSGSLLPNVDLIPAIDAEPDAGNPAVPGVP